MRRGFARARRARGVAVPAFIEPTYALTGPRTSSFTTTTPPGGYTTDNLPGGVLQGSVARFVGRQFTESVALGGGNTGVTFEFIDCVFDKALLLYGNAPEVTVSRCRVEGGIFANSVKGTVEHSSVMGRSTPFQFERYKLDNSGPGGTHQTPWVLRDNYIAVRGPLVAGPDHSEALHIGIAGGSDGFQILRNSLVVPLTPSAGGSYTDGVTALFNMDGPNKDMLIDRNWMRAYTPSSFVYLNGTDMRMTNNKVWRGNTATPQQGGGGGGANPGVYADVNTVSTGRVLTGNTWLNDGTPVGGWF